MNEWILVGLGVGIAGLLVPTSAGPMKRLGLIVLVVLLSACARYRGDAEEVTFKSSDGVTLAGTLVFPKRVEGKVPGVVLFHGSEPATRSFAYRMHGNIFLDRGMAVLLYDKRGAGDSEGDHDNATYAQFIEDALAAVAFLRAHEDIGEIGLKSGSESGWFAPEVAERAGNISFLINKVGPCSSFLETVEWEVYNEFLKDNMSEQAAREKAALQRRVWSWQISPTEAERAALEPLVEELKPASAEAVANLSYDPTPFLERLEVPSLYIYGSEDVNIPTAECVRRLTELKDTGRPVSVHVFEGEGHELGHVGLTGYRFVDGYADLIGEFAHANVKREE